MCLFPSAGGCRLRPKTSLSPKCPFQKRPESGTRRNSNRRLTSSLSPVLLVSILPDCLDLESDGNLSLSLLISLFAEKPEGISRRSRASIVDLWPKCWKWPRLGVSSPKPGLGPEEGSRASPPTCIPNLRPNPAPQPHTFCVPNLRPAPPICVPNLRPVCLRMPHICAHLAPRLPPRPTLAERPGKG